MYDGDSDFGFAHFHMYANFISFITRLTLNGTLVFFLREEAETVKRQITQNVTATF